MESLDPAVLVSGLSFAYNGHPVLRDNNLEISRGKLTFILGKNGSGKSTFLRILAGLLPISQGIVKVSGLDMRSCSAHDRAKTIGFLNQHHRPGLPFCGRRGCSYREGQLYSVRSRGER
ncbi:MAG: ABC transporter ATP-binding protein [Bacteroidales bacterium]